MSFVESPRFPEYIALNASGGPEFKTEIVVIDSGYEQRNARWSHSRARYSLEAPLLAASKDVLVAFFRSMQGRAHGFRLRDWSDYSVDLTSGYLGTTALGSGLATYQLYKYYAQGLTELRPITKPVSGSAALYRGGVLQTAGAGAGNYALDTTTGIVTFVADGTRNVTAVTIAASAVVTLNTALTGIVVGSKIYLSGLVGTVGNVLNGLAHTVTNVASNVYTISTATTGLVYTSGGSASKFPQPSEAMLWTGEFDVPVRFDNDYLQLTIEAPNVFRAQQVSLIEIRV